LNHDFFNANSPHQKEYLGKRESVYATRSVPKTGAIKILFQTNRLHSLIASALFEWRKKRFAGIALQLFASSRE